MPTLTAEPAIRPWGLTRMAPFGPSLPLPYVQIELDPATQTARYLDDGGQVIEMGKHGTQKTSTSTSQDGKQVPDSD